MPSQEHQTIVDMLRTMAAAAPDTSPTVEERRATYEMVASAYPVPDDVEVASVDAGGVACDWVAAPGVDPARVVQYLHGGGYGIGSRTTHRELASRISRASGARVLVVEYRLAPEHAFPAAVDDSVAVYRWLLGEGVEPARLVIGGDSAGGGLAVATLIALRDAGEPLPAAGVCLSPWFDLELTGESMTSKADADPVVTFAGLKEWADNYLRGQDARQPLASPLYADLAGLPPLLVQVGTAEVLLDDAARFADRAREAGTSIDFERYDDLIHIFQQLAATAPEAEDAVASIGRFVRARVV